MRAHAERGDAAFRAPAAVPAQDDEPSPHLGMFLIGLAGVANTPVSRCAGALKHTSSPAGQVSLRSWVRQARVNEQVPTTVMEVFVARSVSPLVLIILG